MGIPAESKNKLLSLLRVYDKVYEEFRRFENPFLDRMAESWFKCRGKYYEIVDGQVKGVRTTSLIGGLEQGLLELPNIISALPSELYERAYSSYKNALREGAPNLLEKVDATLQKVVDRGVIVSEQEFYLVRQAVETMEMLAIKIS